MAATSEDSTPDLIIAADASRADLSDDKIWLRLFDIMNERRNVIAQRLGGPLLLCLPERLEPLFASAAPDFWSIRSLKVHPEVAPVTPIDRGLEMLSRPEAVSLRGMPTAARSVAPAIVSHGQARTMIVVSELLLSRKPTRATKAFKEFLDYVAREEGTSGPLGAWHRSAAKVARRLTTSSGAFGSGPVPR